MKPSIKKIRSLLIALAAVLLLGDGAYLYVSHNREARPTLSVEGENEVHFIDVGQGDSSLIISGNEAVLIDAGEASAADAVLSHLSALDIDTLAAVIVTHPHSDHIGGMADVISQITIETFYMGAETTNTSVYSNMLSALEAQEITPTVPVPGDSFTFASGAALYFLGPNESVAANNLNNRSIICLLDTGEASVLFTGDAEKQAEAALLEDYPELYCDVLKVGHHGSNTSTTEAFLRATNPMIAVISCGANNDYGHPSEQTLTRLSDYGVNDVRITAEQGTIILNLDELSQRKENAA